MTDRNMRTLAQARRDAYNALHLELRSGRKRRGRVCQRCRRKPRWPGRIEAHHEDYSRPLDVKWLCSRCHAMTRQKSRII